MKPDFNYEEKRGRKHTSTLTLNLNWGGGKKDIFVL